MPCGRAGAARRPADDRRCPSRPAGASRSGSSPTPTSCSRGSRTRLRDRRRATRPRRRSRWRSSSAFSISRRSSARCSCCATCSASAPRRSPRCSTTSEASVNSLLRRARAAFESRLPAAGRERAPLPNSKLERDIVGRFAEAVETGDIDGMVALLTDDAWLTMPPAPARVPGPRRDRRVPAPRPRSAAARRCGSCRRAPTRQPAFGCYLPVPGDRRSRVRTRSSCSPSRATEISAITWFADSSVFPHFGLPRILR